MNCEKRSRFFLLISGSFYISLLFLYTFFCFLFFFVLFCFYIFFLLFISVCPSLTDPAWRRTTPGEANIPEPIIVPTISATPFKKKVREKEKKTIPKIKREKREKKETIAAMKTKYNTEIDEEEDAESQKKKSWFARFRQQKLSSQFRSGRVHLPQRDSMFSSALLSLSFPN